MKLYFKKLFFSFLAIILFFPFLCQAGFLNPEISNDIETQTTGLSNEAGYDQSADIGLIMTSVIKGFLALLSIIFIVLILLAGYNWMTAQGEEEKINKAKDTIMRAIIGLVIVIAAYAITYFVFTNLPGGGSSSGLGGS